ncbi:MAG TPA: ubiquinol-cytochrome c reductase cytochrome b subunit [Acidimicrobiales bacterium]|nr:ubiquinol-cytochrome c reductase cytochrome b subunit [Acidimicrobiales bacterium]
MEATYAWIDDRLAVSRGARKLLDKIFPDHWSFMIGEIALYSFIVLLASGVFLTLYYVPSGTPVVYHGPYLPLVGQKMSESYASTINLSFSVRGGLLMRQAHHWAADIFIGAIVVHMLRLFFTGAFRKPRELNWAIGATLLTLAILNGFLGYSLPDDLISGTGLRIGFSILESIPIVGEFLAIFLWGGNYPGTSAIIPRFFIIHVLIMPLVILGLITAHLAILVHQKHTQFPGNGAREDNVVGSPLWPNYSAKAGGFFFLTTGLTFLLAAFVQINPIWLYGPYDPYKVSYAVQPDWYMGWLDGALRLMPSWEIHFPGHIIPNPFFPGVLMPGITFGLIYAWPFLEAFVTGDKKEHHLLDRPRDHPVRTSIGAAVFAFYFVLFGASATDVLANYLVLNLAYVLVFFRYAVVIVPLIVGPVTYKFCKELVQTPGSGQRKRHNLVLRSASGGYSTVPTDPRPGDVETELEPLAIDEIDLVPAMAAGSNGDGRPSSAAGADGQGESGAGVYRVPREYR